MRPLPSVQRRLQNYFRNPSSNMSNFSTPIATEVQMRSRLYIKQVVILAALAASGAALAAGAAPSPQGGAGDAQMHQEMMGGAMMGGNMMDMMRSCQSMMGSGAAMSSMGMPKLPPGNEKLEAQMHAQMMQKMGEIAASYAERAK